MMAGRKDFNSIVIGSYGSDRDVHLYKLAELPIPDEAVTLTDSRDYRFFIYKVSDSEEARRPVAGLEAKVGDLHNCDGIVTPNHGILPFVYRTYLEYPQAVVTRKGRLFIVEHLLENSSAVEWILKGAEHCQAIFQDQNRFEEAYEKSKQLPQRVLRWCLQ